MTSVKMADRYKIKHENMQATDKIQHCDKQVLPTWTWENKLFSTVLLNLKNQPPHWYLPMNLVLAVACAGQAENNGWDVVLPSVLPGVLRH